MRVLHTNYIKSLIKKYDIPAPWNLSETRARWITPEGDWVLLTVHERVRVEAYHHLKMYQKSQKQEIINDLNSLFNQYQMLPIRKTNQTT